MAIRTLHRFPCWLGVILLALAAVETTAHAAAGRWLLDSRTHCRVWQAEPPPQASIRWSGACKNGRAHGHGLLQWVIEGKPKGEFAGAYRDGKADGQGVAIFPDGSRYEGEWRKGKRYGHGVATFVDGSRYEGDWREDKMNGPGVRTWPNGDRYDGDWQEN